MPSFVVGGLDGSKGRFAVGSAGSSAFVSFGVTPSPATFEDSSLINRANVWELT
jgi:hypothetical protein